MQKNNWASTFNEYVTKWENANVSSNKNFSKWVFQPTGTEERTPVPPPPSDEELIEKLIPRMEDKGMFKDIVAWLRKDAPKRLRGALNNLNSPLVTSISYETLCRTVYEMHFRASEVIERRMILGEGNQWTKRYFEDFPPS